MGRLPRTAQRLHTPLYGATCFANPVRSPKIAPGYSTPAKACE